MQNFEAIKDQATNLYERMHHAASDGEAILMICSVLIEVQGHAALQAIEECERRLVPMVSHARD